MPFTASSVVQRQNATTIASLIQVMEDKKEKGAESLYFLSDHKQKENYIFIHIHLYMYHKSHICHQRPHMITYIIQSSPYKRNYPKAINPTCY